MSKSNQSLQNMSYKYDLFCQILPKAIICNFTDNFGHAINWNITL